LARPVEAHCVASERTRVVQTTEDGMRKNSKPWPGMTIGMDVGDRSSCLCVMDRDCEILEESKVPTTPKAIKARFTTTEPMRVVIETGTHANWLHDVLEGLGHDVIVADARQLKLISESTRKDDRRDAETLAEMGVRGSRMLNPVDPRSPEARKDLEVLRARATLVTVRTMLVNHIRGVVKSFGHRMPDCSSESLHKRDVPEELKGELSTMMSMLESTSAAIKAYDKQAAHLAETKYPQTKVLEQVTGVGRLTSLCYVLTIGDPWRFEDSRDVGAFVGVVSGKHQSGDKDPKMRITKRGDAMLRTLLVQCAQHILRQSSPDTDLKRFGKRVIDKGGKYPKQRAAVAVARKLSVLLLVMWKTSEVYEPLRNTKTKRKS
jgi:transposase